MGRKDDPGGESVGEGPSPPALVAVLYFGASSAPVHVRRLTPRNARVEGRGLPQAGTDIVLKRGKLHARGVVAWSSAGVRGLSFSPPVDSWSWVHGLSAPQEQNDQTVFSLGLLTAQDKFRDLEEGGLSVDRVLEQLEVLRADIGKLSDRLADDLILVATRPELQFLDEAMQRIEKIARSLLDLGTEP